MSWKKVSSQIIFTHPRITLIEDTVELPTGEQVPYLTFATKNDSAAVICIDKEKVLLQKEYAYPTGEELYQFPGGKVERDEQNIDGAMRELAEEAGLKSDGLELLGWFYMDNRRTNAKQYVYLAKNCRVTEKKGGDKEESITSHWVPIREVNDMIRKGEIVNYSLLASWAMYKASL